MSEEAPPGDAPVPTPEPVTEPTVDTVQTEASVEPAPEPVQAEPVAETSTSEQGAASADGEVVAEVAKEASPERQVEVAESPVAERKDNQSPVRERRVPSVSSDGALSPAPQTPGSPMSQASPGITSPKTPSNLEAETLGMDTPTIVSPKPQVLRAVDFEFGDMLGEGAYSRVVHATRKSTNEVFAIKVMEKRHIIKEKKQAYVKMERDILNMLDHPNIVQLICTFQDQYSLYFVLEYAVGGELFEVLKEYGTLGETISKFYAAEIINAVQYLHEKNVIHRDLKPENILLSEQGHIKLTDFGTARMLGDSKRNTFCGTAEYVSPEVLQDQGACQSSDLWALGCIVFQFFSGCVPFRGESEYLTFQLILKLEYAFPDPFPEDAADLVRKLLVLEPEERLGAGPEGNASNYAALCAHPFFEGMDWKNLHLSPPPPRSSYVQKLVPPADTAAAACDGANQQWAKHLADNERVVYTAVVVKKRGLFSSKRRQLILTTAPRLLYVDTQKDLPKGQIHLNAQVKPVLKNPREFVVQTPGRNYYFEDQTGQAEVWVDKILATQQPASLG